MDAFFVKDAFTVTPGYDEYYSALNTMGLYDDIDFCAKLTAVKADPEGNSFAGIIFWGIDYDNYYYLVVTAEGSVGVFRRQRGRVLAQLRWATFDGLKKGNGATNELRVGTVGNEATVYINGTEYGHIRGQPPSDGQEIGVRATSPRNDRGIWAFDDIKVTRAALGATVEMPVRDDPRADARPDLDHDDVGVAGRDARPPLPERQDVDVVVDPDRGAIAGREPLPDRVAIPAGHDRRRDRAARVELDRTGHTDADAPQPSVAGPGSSAAGCRTGRRRGPGRPPGRPRSGPAHRGGRGSARRASSPRRRCWSRRGPRRGYARHPPGT